MSDKIKLVSGKVVGVGDFIYIVDKTSLKIAQWHYIKGLILKGNSHYSEVFATPEEAEKWLENYKERLSILKEAKQEVQDHNIIKPNYYKGKSGQDVLDVIEDFELDFYLGNCSKYIIRSGKKEGESALKDLLKAKEYIERKIKTLSK